MLWLALLSFILRFRECFTEDASCSRVDFNSATISTLAKCEFTQEYVVKSYAPAFDFRPFRPNSKHYLSTQWEGLSCGETVQSFSLNSQSEFRMVYNLIVNSGASLEVRVLDLDRLENNSNPVVIRWKTEQGTTKGWGLFRERMDSTVKRAKVQIEANMNTGSALAIEYFTVFNYEVETNECQAIDEFAPVTTTEVENIVTTTEALPVETTTTTTTIDISTTEENADNPSTTPTSIESTPVSTKAPTQVVMDNNNSMDWIWMALAALFASLLVLAMAGVIYVYVISKHLLTKHGWINEEKSEQFESYSNHGSEHEQQRSKC